MLPYLFSSMAMAAVGRAAFDMIEEVRRQFREIPGLLEGKARADYAKCVDISTKAAIKEMVLPGLLAILTPVFFGLVLRDKEMLAGVLAGVTVSGVLLAIFMSNAGGAWDNAKKTIESGVSGGKGSDAHKASVVGDRDGGVYGKLHVSSYTAPVSKISPPPRLLEAVVEREPRNSGRETPS
jgi:K(+)-stimulated pyrophosphate-energized sodium pump